MRVMDVSALVLVNKPDLGLMEAVFAYEGRVGAEGPHLILSATYTRTLTLKVPQYTHPAAPQTVCSLIDLCRIAVHSLIGNTKLYSINYRQTQPRTKSINTPYNYFLPTDPISFHHETGKIDYQVSYASYQ